MEDKETINILIAQLLSKDDEILRLRNLLDDLQREQQSGNMQILSKLDRALEELKSMRHDNKTLSNRLSRALEAKSAAEEKIQELSSALEALENRALMNFMRLPDRNGSYTGVNPRRNLPCPQ